MILHLQLLLGWNPFQMRPKQEVTDTASFKRTYSAFLWVFVDILYTYKHFLSIITICVCLLSHQDSFCSSASPWCWSWWPPQESPLSYDSQLWINCDWRRRRRACRWCCRRRTRHTCPQPFLIQDSRHSRGSVKQRREGSADEEVQKCDDWSSSIIS